MLALLQNASRSLAERKVPHALIGAAAMAAHGVVRATGDVDLLALDRTLLDPATWESYRRSGVAVDARRGDDTDPLAGVVRLASQSETLDLVIGRSPWMKGVLERATTKDIAGVAIPVATVPDLVLLKVYAGAARDLYDVQELLALGNRQAVQAAVEQEISRLPRDARDQWHAITRGRSRGR